MFSEHTLLFRKICSLSNFVGSCGLEWDPIMKRLNPDAGQRLKWAFGKLKIYRIIVILLTVQTILYAKVLKEPPMSPLTNLIAGTGIVVHLVAVVHIGECLNPIPETILYINGLFQFDSMYKVGSKPKYFESLKRQPLLTQLSLLFSIGLYNSTMSIPSMAVYGLHYFHPCKNSLYGFWLLPQCNVVLKFEDSEFLNFVMKYGIFFMNQILWTYALNMTPFIIGILLSVSVFSLRENIQQFWKFYRGGLLPYHKLILMYRQIQVLSTIGNSICQRRLIPMMIIFTITLHSSFSTALVKARVASSNSSEALLLIFLSVMILINSLSITMLCLGGMAAVYRVSKRTIQSIKHSQAGRTGRGKRVIEKSFQLIKVKFGSSNFVDEITPLTCLSVANEVTMNVLLLS